MTSLVAWVGADSHGPSSLNIATDSRITWRQHPSVADSWDQGKKVFASSTKPLLVAFTGDVLFPTLVIPGIIDRIDREIWKPDGAPLQGFIDALRRGWRDYPAKEKRALNVYIAHREAMACCRSSD